MLEFYKKNEHNDYDAIITRCNVDAPYIIPITGDIVKLPIDDDDGELYKIKRRIVFDDCVEFFCELYNWEA